ncbi:hypothetical protein TWF281_002958 [Arthrobotrys megalospora]
MLSIRYSLTPLIIFLLSFTGPTSAFYISILDHIRLPWWDTNVVQQYPEFQKYRNTASCHPVPTLSTSPDNYIEALVIYNPPGEVPATALGFWKDELCDAASRTRPEFIVRLPKQKEIGITILPLALKGMKVAVKSFRWMMPYKETTGPGGYIRGLVKFPQEASVVGFTISHGEGTGAEVATPYSWSVKSGLLDTPWWLPEIPKIFLRRVLRDMGERALDNVIGVSHPFTLWARLREAISPDVVANIRANAESIGRTLANLYDNPDPPSPDMMSLPANALRPVLEMTIPNQVPLGSQPQARPQVLPDTRPSDSYTDARGRKLYPPGINRQPLMVDQRTEARNEQILPNPDHQLGVMNQGTHSPPAANPHGAGLEPQIQLQGGIQPGIDTQGQNSYFFSQPQEGTEPQYQDYTEPQDEDEIQPETVFQIPSNVQPQGRFKSRIPMLFQDEGGYIDQSRPQYENQFQNQNQFRDDMDPPTQFEDEPQFDYTEPKYRNQFQPQEQYRNTEEFQPQDQSQFQPQDQYEFQPLDQSHPQDQLQSQDQFQPQEQSQFQPQDQYQSQLQDQSQPQDQSQLQPQPQYQNEAQLQSQAQLQQFQYQPQAQPNSQPNTDDIPIPPQQDQSFNNPEIAPQNKAIISSEDGTRSQVPGADKLEKQLFDFIADIYDDGTKNEEIEKLARVKDLPTSINNQATRNTGTTFNHIQPTQFESSHSANTGGNWNQDLLQNKDFFSLGSGWGRDKGKDRSGERTDLSITDFLANFDPITGLQFPSNRQNPSSNTLPKAGSILSEVSNVNLGYNYDPNNIPGQPIYQGDLNPLFRTQFIEPNDPLSGIKENEAFLRSLRKTNHNSNEQTSDPTEGYASQNFGPQTPSTNPNARFSNAENDDTEYRSEVLGRLEELEKKRRTY